MPGNEQLQISSPPKPKPKLGMKGFGAQKRTVANGILSDLLSGPRYKALASEFGAPGVGAKNV